MTAPLSSSCGTLTWVAENRTCDPVTYTGQVCQEHLLEWQSCIVGQNRSNVILISTEESQLNLEQQVLEAIEVISQFNMYTGKLMNLILVLHLMLYTIHACISIDIPFNVHFKINLPSNFTESYGHCERNLAHMCELTYKLCLEHVYTIMCTCVECENLCMHAMSANFSVCMYLHYR